MGQSNLLDLLLSRPSKRRYDGEVIDLTSDAEEIEDKDEIQMVAMANNDELNNIEKEEQENEDQILVKKEEDKEIPRNAIVSEVASEEEDGNIEDIDPTKEYTNDDSNSNDIIPCPVCLLNISKLNLSDRESHVELCLLQPTTHKSIVKPSPKKLPKPLKPTKEPKQRTKPIPNFKILTFKNNHKIIVDGFQFINHPNIDQYFLSHYHSDHYIGLGKTWNQGKIFTSITTANLLKTIMKIPEEKIIGIPLNQSFMIHDKIEMILYDANHCPGGVIFLFQEYNNQGEIIKRILHTGDFRVSYNHIKNFSPIFIDEIYLDTTYMNPVYTFMPQNHVVEKTSKFVSKIVDQTIRKNSILNYFQNSNDYLIIIGAYSIGKEKLYINLAKTINSKILITKERYKMLSCIDGFKDLKIFQTEESNDCKIQIVSIGKLSDLSYLSKFQNKKIIKIKPTGWSFNTFKKDSNKGLSLDQILIKTLSNSIQTPDFETQLLHQFQKSSSLNVPYSEHSSFKELSIFGCFLKWGEIIPTVNVENEFFKNWFELWRQYKLDKSIVDEYFSQHSLECT